ncbi:hypothetical protein H8S20_13680 [Clostridium sp. NSJ-6]|uniref:DUF7922 domain-containing protein n=1 Tax=Clostridium hominis TaxID=2763036 RepID=A0ABR7DGH4_9CLOT|nr:hypothetical protein [Clostridium hominis]MDU2673873.1 hypothetical protein [Clostridium sp.]
MASNNKLYRNFIILQEDERGYSNASDKTLSGYSKIEARAEKCKVSFYAQNLKKDTDDYHMILICCKKDCKQIIDLGKIVIGDSGKCEMTKEYDASNIGGLGVSFDKICGAALAKMKDGLPIYVMCGFLNSEQPSDSWKNYKVVKCNEHKQTTMEKKPKKDECKDDKKSDKKSEKKSDKCEEKCEHKKRDDDDKPVEISSISKEDNDGEVQEKPRGEEVNTEESKVEEPKIEESKIEEPKIEEVPYVPRENLRGKFEDYEEQIEAVKEFDPDVSDIRGSIGEYFEAVSDGFQRCKGKYKEVKFTKWYKVPVNDLYEMCNMSNYNKYTLAYYPMLNYYPYIKKHGYFMLGYKCDSEGNLKYIVYGVPGKKDKDEQPYDGKTGFVTWVKDKDVDDVGCWLMFYDYKNSTVVVPMQ